MSRSILAAAIAAVLLLPATGARANVFNYHGRLQDGGNAANGKYDIELTVYSAQSGGHILAGPVALHDVDVHDGAFSAPVDFDLPGGLSAQSWVEAKVKPVAGSTFSAAIDRSPVAPAGTCPGSWNIDGNAGIPAGSYLGTSDTNNLVFQVNGTYVGYFDATSFGFAASGADGAPGFKSTAVSDSFGAVGAFSFAGGAQALASNFGSFVWGGAATNDPEITDSGPDQVIFQAQGGFGINTSAGPTGSGPLGAELTIAPEQPGLDSDINLIENSQTPYDGFDIYAHEDGFFGIDLIKDIGGGSIEYEPVMFVNAAGTGGVGDSEIMFNTKSQIGAALVVGDTHGGLGGGANLSSGGVWTNASSRTLKEGFADVDVAAVLDKVVALPVQTWFYKASHAEGVHMGPMAEDFAETFTLGADNKHIATGDESGVTIAAIQGLNQKLEKETSALKTENAELKKRLDSLAEELARLGSR